MEMWTKGILYGLIITIVLSIFLGHIWFIMLYTPLFFLLLITSIFLCELFIYKKRHFYFALIFVLISLGILAMLKIDLIPLWCSVTKYWCSWHPITGVFEGAEHFPPLFSLIVLSIYLGAFISWLIELFKNEEKKDELKKVSKVIIIMLLLLPLPFISIFYQGYTCNNPTDARCLSKLYEKNSNPDACNKFSKDMQWHCYKYYAGKLGTESICEKISTQYEKEDCYEYIAEITKSYSLCEKITNSQMKIDCYYYVGKELDDYTVCRKFESEGRREQCYVEFAKRLNNSDICNDIPENGLRQMCIYDISK